MLRWFVLKGHVFIVLPLCGESLFDWMDREGPYPLEHVRSYVYCIIKGLQVMQKAHLVHTDLKPENLIFDTPNVKYEKVDVSALDRNYLFERNYADSHLNKQIKIPLFY